MSALGRYGRFTLFHHLSHLPTTLAVSLFFFVGVWGLGVFVALSCFCFLFCKCYGISNSPRVFFGCAGERREDRIEYVRVTQGTVPSLT